MTYHKEHLIYAHCNLKMMSITMHSVSWTKMVDAFISIYGAFNIVHDLYSCVVFHM